MADNLANRLIAALNFGSFSPAEQAKIVNALDECDQIREALRVAEEGLGQFAATKAGVYAIIASDTLARIAAIKEGKA